MAVGSAKRALYREWDCAATQIINYSATILPYFKQKTKPNTK